MLREGAPLGEPWVREIKFDGYRIQAHLRAGRPAIYTRRAYDWTRRFQTIADALMRSGSSRRRTWLRTGADTPL
jgi:bifunctional non-homologous end joining protein LigD